MGYYVLGDQGQKYGPADIATLNVWIGEGRVIASTMLEDEATGAQSPASAVRGLQFAASPNPVLSNQTPQYQQQPYPQPQQPYQPQQYSDYQRPQQYYGGSDQLAQAQYKRSITLAIVSVVFSIIFSIAGILTGIASLVNAMQCKKSGHPNATTAIVISSCALGFYVAIHILRLGWFLMR